MASIRDSIDKNMKSFEVRDYYFNLKNYIHRTYWSQNTQNYLKLYALASIAKDIHKDSSLTDRVVKDVSDMTGNYEAHKSGRINDSESIATNKQSERLDLENEKTPGFLRALDGHFVRSELEQVIDNVLYTNDISHAYQKKVIGIKERSMVADWFIPIGRRGHHGIYIEAWGIENKEDYLNNKKEKLRLYEKYNICLIEIQKDDPKDSQWLEGHILTEYEKYKNLIMSKL